MIRRAHRVFTRRRFIASTAATLGAVAMPRLSRAADRPRITHGVQSGDVSLTSGVIWARADRPARLLVELATTDSFKTIHRAAHVDASSATDFTAKALIEDLPPGQDIFYRVRFEDLATSTIAGEAAVGRFRTAPAHRRSISFVWSGDTAGQGWGIDPARGGMRTYATMRANAPDFFIHSGDNIYADCPIPAELKLANGETWKNIVTEEKSRPAETLAEFRGNYKYNLLDDNLRAFNAEVPMFAQWDDHEVTDDWWPGRQLTRNRYREKSASVLSGARLPRVPRVHADAARCSRTIAHLPQDCLWAAARRADAGYAQLSRAETAPSATGHAPGARCLGPAQVAWLKRELLHSSATWKVIAADLPIGLLNSDAVAQGDGPPRGRETEIADILSFIRRAGIRNTVWITADMHYTAAHYYDPGNAVFQDFTPFWEFVSGPLHAGTWGPGTLDNTFGPRAIYQRGCSQAQGENLAPCYGLQFFGHVAIDGATEAMTVTLKDVDNQALWAVTLDPGTPSPPARVATRWR